MELFKNANGVDGINRAINVPPRKALIIIHLYEKKQKQFASQTLPSDTKNQKTYQKLPFFDFFFDFLSNCVSIYPN
jgi:hypothetical protein